MNMSFSTFIRFINTVCVKHKIFCNLLQVFLIFTGSHELRPERLSWRSRLQLAGARVVEHKREAVKSVAKITFRFTTDRLKKP